MFSFLSSSKLVEFTLAGVTSHPDGFWVGQQARQFVWELQEHEDTFRHLIHDRDSKYTKVFDDVFLSEGINIIRTPVQALWWLLNSSIVFT